MPPGRLPQCIHRILSARGILSEGVRSVYYFLSQAYLAIQTLFYHMRKCRARRVFFRKRVLFVFVKFLFQTNLTRLKVRCELELAHVGIQRRKAVAVGRIKITAFMLMVFA